MVSYIAFALLYLQTDAVARYSYFPTQLHLEVCLQSRQLIETRLLIASFELLINADFIAKYFSTLFMTRPPLNLVLSLQQLCLIFTVIAI